MQNEKKYIHTYYITIISINVFNINKILIFVKILNLHVNCVQDEYEKKHDFYDEYHEDGGSEKHGGWHEEHEGKKGGHEKKGHLQSGHHEVIIY